jgi:hypothetical protein
MVAHDAGKCQAAVSLFTTRRIMWTQPSRVHAAHITHSVVLPPFLISPTAVLTGFNAIEWSKSFTLTSSTFSWSSALRTCSYVLYTSPRSRAVSHNLDDDL